MVRRTEPSAALKLTLLSPWHATEGRTCVWCSALYPITGAVVDWQPLDRLASYLRDQIKIVVFVPSVALRRAVSGWDTLVKMVPAEHGETDSDLL